MPTNLQNEIRNQTIRQGRARNELAKQATGFRGENDEAIAQVAAQVSAMIDAGKSSEEIDRVIADAGITFRDFLAFNSRRRLIRHH